MEVNEIRIEAQDLNQQGALLLKTGNFGAAQEKFDKAIELDPMLAESYKNYGDLHMAQQNYKEAKNDYKKALLIGKSGVLYFAYGNACFMNDEMHEGLENYNLALSNGYDNDEMVFFMGMAYEHLNDDHMALRYFQKACLKNPSRPDFIIKKISVMVRMKMYDSAQEAVEELLKKSPELYDGYHIKTQLLIQKKKLEEALVFAKAASDRFPEDVDLMFDYVKCLALKNEHEKAEKLIEIAKRMKYFENTKYEFTLLEAQIAAERKNLDKAIKCCEACIEMENEKFFASDARFMQMNLYLVTPNYEKALDNAEAIVNKKMKDDYYYAALYYQPFCIKQMGRKEEAKELYEKANIIYRMKTLEEPAAIDIYLYRVMCLKDMENYEKALEILDFVENLSAEISEVYTLRAEIYRSQENMIQAQEEMEKAYAIKPELRAVYTKEGE